MKKLLRIAISIAIVVALTINYAVVFAEPPEMPSGQSMGANGGTPPDMPPDGGNGNASGGGAPGGNGGSTTVSHTGATEISSDTSKTGEAFTSTTGAQNALLVTGGTSTITNSTVTKSGEASGDDADFYGTNAGVLVKEGTLNISGGTVTTNGSHANAVFAYSNGTININDTTIKTTSNNSGAVMVTGGGTLTADNVTAQTDGNSSAPIRSDRGGGTLTVNGGKYTSHGTGSPVIYSTANIIANNAVLTSTASEGVVVEGKNSVTLNNSTLEATNTKLNSNSETYKAIFIYQSMSGDADQGTASFTAKDSKIVNNKGDVIFVTNTSTNIELENNTITNNDADGAFIRIGAAKWGTSGANGGSVTLNAKNQKIEGNVVVDNISTLDFSLKNGSGYVGTINKDNTAKTLNVTLDSSSTLTLTGDTYITSLNNEVADNSNINLNGHILYVNGTAITSTDYKGAIATVASKNSESESSTEKTQNIKMIVVIAGAAVVGILIIVCAIVIAKKRGK